MLKKIEALLYSGIPANISLVLAKSQQIDLAIAAYQRLFEWQ